MTSTPTARQRVERRVLHRALSLPPRVQRVLAGRPVRRDGQTLDVGTQLMLRLQKLGRRPAAESLPIPAGRAEIDYNAWLVGGDIPVGAVLDLEVAGRPARLYSPGEDADPGPLLVFFHGGGFIYGGLDSHDSVCRFLAERADVRVLAIDYRLAPEHPFPAAHDDAAAAYRWVVANPGAVGADPARLAVGGDSAGGNLAAHVAQVAAREGLPLAFQLLIYPVADALSHSASRDRFGAGFYLTTEFIGLATESYTPDVADRADPRMSPLRGSVPTGLAPAYVATAGFDPLRDEGESYARLLEDAGVPVQVQQFPGLIHGFVNIVGPRGANQGPVLQLAAALRAGLRRR